jgi:chromosome segregation ATPase
MKQETDLLRGESERLLTDLTLASEERTETAKEIRRLRGHLDGMQAQVRDQEEHVERLKATVVEAQNATEARSKSFEETITKLQDRVRLLEEQLDQRGRELSEANASRAELREENDALKSQVRKLELSRADLDRVRMLMQAFALKGEEEP